MDFHAISLRNIKKFANQSSNFLRLMQVTLNQKYNLRNQLKKSFEKDLLNKEYQIVLEEIKVY